MCKHTRELTLKRNAVVCIRQGLWRVVDVNPFGPMSEELSRHENYYDWLIDQWEEECPVCCEIAYSDKQYPAAWNEIEQKYEERICEDLKIWGKRRVINA